MCVGVHLGVPKFITWETGLMRKLHRERGEEEDVEVYFGVCCCHVELGKI